MPHYTKREQRIMKRCLRLASFGAHHVKSNPVVGAVIVHDGRIIGEGYHKMYGGPHAEIEALNNVVKEDRHLIKGSHLYVSLEPCFHHGKTPPCVDTIIAASIGKVTICNLDPNPKTKGKSVSKLRAHGITVDVGLLSDEAAILNKKFFVNQEGQVPYIMLKWAQSKDRFIGQKGMQIWLSNHQSNLLVHRWREEVDGIMVGTNTAIHDNPQLTNRRPIGASPMRLILDRQGRIPKSHHVLCDEYLTKIFTQTKDYPTETNKEAIVINEGEWNLSQIMRSIYKIGIGSIMVEGGLALLTSLIRSNLWHEARIIETTKILKKGVKAPMIGGRISKQFALDQDKVLIINNLKEKVVCSDNG